MKLKGAAGPDDIPPMFLKSLGPHTINELLDIQSVVLARRLLENIEDCHHHLATKVGKTS